MSGGVEPAPRPRRVWVSRLLTGAVGLVLGFAATVQVQQARAPERYSGATQEDLVEILDSQKSEEDGLRQQIAQDQQAVDTLSRSDVNSGRALSEAQQRAAAIAVLNGSAPASGPGVRVTVSDPERSVPPSVLLSAIEELRGAGAEAIQVNDVRVVASTYVAGSPGGVVVDGTPLTSPYVILAIGPGSDLAAALTASGSLVSDVSRARGSAQVDSVARVEVSAVVRR